jgi:hypothetical protein
MGAGILSQGYIGRGVKYTTHLNVVPRITSGAYTSTPPACIHDVYVKNG